MCMTLMGYAVEPLPLGIMGWCMVCVCDISNNRKISAQFENQASDVCKALYYVRTSRNWHKKTSTVAFIYLFLFIYTLF